MTLRWGIAGSGRFCHDFVIALQTYAEKEHKINVVADLARDSADKFASNHNIAKVYGNYLELSMDKDVGKFKIIPYYQKRSLNSLKTTLEIIPTSWDLSNINWMDGNII